MINHTRTLLLNARIAGDTTYMPPEFQPVTLTGTVEAVERVIFPEPVATGQGRLDTVDALLCLVHRLELDVYTRVFDPRITYVPGQRSDISLQEFITSGPAVSPSQLSQSVDRVAGSSVLQTVSPLLFQWAENTPRGDELALLRRAWVAGTDKALSVGAVIMAYVYQVERTRLSI
jgi:hypothetical protein